MKISVSKGYIFFVLGIILVIFLTYFKITCPLDEGTGIIIGNPEILVEKVEGELLKYEEYDYCGDIYGIYNYAVKISLENKTEIPWYGGLVLGFYDPATVNIMTYEQALDEAEGDESGLPMGAKERGVVYNFLAPPVSLDIVFIEVPSETDTTIEKNVRFEGLNMERLVMEDPVLWAEVGRKILCPYCGGTGKVPLYEWIRIQVKVL